jgi:hypothetical protein
MTLQALPRAVLFGGITLFVYAAAAGAAAVPDKEFRIDRFDWEAEPELARAVKRIVVRNDYGDVRARSAGGGPLNVHAVIQRLGSAPDVGVNVERHGEALSVTVVAPPGRQAVSEERPAKTAVDRVDLVVYVPEGAVLEATTLRGIVEAKRLKGPVEAETLDGEIRVDAAGAVRARSSSGSITVVLGNATAASLIETRTGTAWVSLLEGSDYQLIVEPGGSVTSQIPLKEEKAAPRRRLTALLGAALTPVVVRSDWGDVEIVKRKP